MSKIITRRGFLGALGAAAGGIVLAQAEPVRRFWQVGSAAPVAARDPHGALIVTAVDHGAKEVCFEGWIRRRQTELQRQYDHELAELAEGYENDYGSELFSLPVHAPDDQGLTYDTPHAYRTRLYGAPVIVAAPSRSMWLTDITLAE